MIGFLRPTNRSVLARTVALHLARLGQLDQVSLHGEPRRAAQSGRQADVDGLHNLRDGRGAQDQGLAADPSQRGEDVERARMVVEHTGAEDEDGDDAQDVRARCFVTRTSWP